MIIFCCGYLVSRHPSKNTNVLAMYAKHTYLDVFKNVKMYLNNFGDALTLIAQVEWINHIKVQGWRNGFQSGGAMEH